MCGPKRFALGSARNSRNSVECGAGPDPRFASSADGFGQQLMAGNHWLEYHRAWSRLTPPLRPHAEVIAAVRQQIAGFPGRALLLGVTPELADVVSDLVAIDRNSRW